MNQNNMDYYDGFGTGYDTARESTSTASDFYESITQDSDYNQGLVAGFNQGCKDREGERILELNQLYSIPDLEQELTR